MEAIKNFFATLTLSKILPAVLILLVGLIAAKILSKLFIEMLERSKLNKSLHKMLSTVFGILLNGIVILIVLSTLGIDLTSLIAMLSVLSLAISLAVQGTLSNVAGGVQVLSAHPFQVGDFVEVSGQSGTVLETGLVYTTILTPDNKRVYFPNSDVAASTIVNYSVEGKRRVDLTFSASYDAPADKVLAALREAAKCDQLLPGEEIFAAVNHYGESVIEYALRSWCKPDDYWAVYFGTIERVRKSFEKAGVEMSYPHLNVHIDNK